MELRETFVLWQVCVPYSNDLVDVKLSGQVTRDPSIGKIHEHDLFILKILQIAGIDLLNDSFHLVDHFVDTRLHISIVVLYVIDQLA